MKKLALIFSIFLFLSCNINTVTSFAQLTTTPSFSEGFYTITDLKLAPNAAYKIQNISPNKVFVIVFDDDQKIQQSIRLEPNSPKYSIKPLQFNYKVVILGNGQVTFTT